jgi:hypothetical protein
MSITPYRSNRNLNPLSDRWQLFDRDWQPLPRPYRGHRDSAVTAAYFKLRHYQRPHEVALPTLRLVLLSADDPQPTPQDA